MNNEVNICEKCFLIECCCEADRKLRIENDKLEIELFHKAKVGSRLHRKIKECPCGQHDN